MAVFAKSDQILTRILMKPSFGIVSMMDLKILFRSATYALEAINLQAFGAYSLPPIRLKIFLISFLIRKITVFGIKFAFFLCPIVAFDITYMRSCDTFRDQIRNMGSFRNVRDAAMNDMPLRIQDKSHINAFRNEPHFIRRLLFVKHDDHCFPRAFCETDLEQCPVTSQIIYISEHHIGSVYLMEADLHYLFSCERISRASGIRLAVT